MTAKRDLKRRVRQRQVRTGESYVTARRRVLAAREGRTEEAPSEDARGAEAAQPAGQAARTDATTGRGEDHRRESVEAARADSEDGQAGERAASGESIAWEGAEAGIEVVARAEGARVAASPMPVVELHDWTEHGLALGFRSRITVYPSVVELALPADVLVRLRDALVHAATEPDTARMFEVAFGVGRGRSAKAFPRTPPSVALLTFSVDGRDGAVDVVCRSWPLAPMLMLRRADDGIEEFLSGVQRVERHLPVAFTRIGLPPLPRLFVIYGEGRYPITREPFVIGRNRRAVDLALDGGLVSGEHAAVISRNGRYYIKDLGSASGIHYKGMRIDNKRIDEGDVFQVGEQPLLFTFREDG